MQEQSQNPIAIINTTIPEQPLNQPQTAYTPPTRTDIIIDIIYERERLKITRLELKAGTRRPSKILTADMYLTQLILSADKIALYALKENNINLTQSNNLQIDISTQVKELIQFSRERQCNRNKPTETS